jgi:hypothetical protein
MSARSEAADQIAIKLTDLGLNEVYGCIAGLRGRFYDITFCKARVTDGSIHYYSDKFVQVKWQTAYRDMQRNGSAVFESVDNALDFVRLAFAEYDVDAAFAIPQKEKK